VPERVKPDDVLPILVIRDKKSGKVLYRGPLPKSVDKVLQLVIGLDGG